MFIQKNKQCVPYTYLRCYKTWSWNIPSVSHLQHFPGQLNSSSFGLVQCFHKCAYWLSQMIWSKPPFCKGRISIIVPILGVKETEAQLLEILLFMCYMGRHWKGPYNMRDPATGVWEILYPVSTGVNGCCCCWKSMLLKTQKHWASTPICELRKWVLTPVLENYTWHFAAIAILSREGIVPLGRSQAGFVWWPPEWHQYIHKYLCMLLSMKSFNSGRRGTWIWIDLLLNSSNFKETMGGDLYLISIFMAALFE